MRDVVVQEEIKVEKCDKCDNEGRVEVERFMEAGICCDSTGGNIIDKPYSYKEKVFCDCEYGQHMRWERSKDLDMFAAARRA